MNFSLFNNAKSPKARICTRDAFMELAGQQWLKDLCNAIANEQDDDKRAEMKKRLPVITWQAWFDDRRVSAKAHPSGLYMLDIDHVDSPIRLYKDNIEPKIEECGIMYAGITASGKGLRVVAKCRKEFTTIEECQRWLAEKLKTEYDGVCKDWARCSFMTDGTRTLYLDMQVFAQNPEPGTVYEVGAKGASTTPTQPPQPIEQLPASREHKDVDQREGLFGGQNEYEGLDLTEIAKEWLRLNGGEPTVGERNAKLYKLATRMRYICDFNQATMLRVMPRYELGEDEMNTLIRSAINSMRATSMPKDLEEAISSLQRGGDKVSDIDDEEIADETSTEKTPSLPPVFREWHKIAPEDFKMPVVLCQLPILGTLCSRLRAKYLDGNMHSPSFQVSLEAPQASGKSFVRKLVDYEMASLKEHDENEREKEREYEQKVREINITKTKVTIKNKDEILGSKPQTIIRFVPATMSITKLLMRTANAQGLHLFAFSEEIDTVHKAFKRSFSSLSDALRNAFDNSDYGQDYASENSFSGILPLYYNTLYCGTPNAMRRFYPDLEDGLVSRVLFVTLPDQFGKPMPIWGEFSDRDRRIVDVALERLNEVSLNGDEVMPEHIMKLDFVNDTLKAWIEKQQALAVKMNDRTRDIFCRRAAVVGFRAAMIGWFLWNERPTPAIRRNVSDFAVWIANCMLNQHLMRFKVDEVTSNTFLARKAYDQLKDVFSRDDLGVALRRNGIKTRSREVLYRWKLQGVVDGDGDGMFKKRGGRV